MLILAVFNIEPSLAVILTIVNLLPGLLAIAFLKEQVGFIAAMNGVFTAIFLVQIFFGFPAAIPGVMITGILFVISLALAKLAR